jgi:hypothetical protein
VRSDSRVDTDALFTREYGYDSIQEQLGGKRKQHDAEVGKRAVGGREKNAAKDVDGEVMLMSASEIHLRKCLIGRMKMMSHVREQSISSMTVYDRYRCVVMEVKIVGQLNSSTKFWSGLKVDELLCTANGVMPLVPRCNAGGKNEASFFTLVSN